MEKKQDLKAYKRAMVDFFLRTICSLTVFVVGYWAPSSYLLEKHGIFAQFGFWRFGGDSVLIC